MQSPNNTRHFADALKVKEIRFFLAAVAFYTLASRSVLVIIGYQIYQLTKSPAALGWLGLVEAIPAISLVLFGGYVADHFDRRKILLVTRVISCLGALALALLSLSQHAGALFGLYAVIFLVGVARGFADPAGNALEAQVVPKHLTVNASSWITSTWITCAIGGPALIGFIFAMWGPVTCYLLAAGSYLLAWLCTFAIKPRPFVRPEKKEPIFQSIGAGLKFMFGSQVLVGAASLDLFAVLFGGAVALLPIYAEDILHVGAKGLGLLNAASSAGALVVTLIATHRPPIAKAGRNLLWSVAGFGVSIIVFAFSKNFWLSMAALFFSGVFDGVSMVIRRSMIRLLSPDHMRGRVAAANWIFLSASNELGAFESGMVAALIGTVPCVAVGGVITLGVVALAAWKAPKLRALRFNPHTMEQQGTVST